MTMKHSGRRLARTAATTVALLALSWPSKSQATGKLAGSLYGLASGLAFAVALRDALADLFEHGPGAARPGSAAHERDHAEVARERAAVLDLHEGPHAIEAGVGLHAPDRTDVAGDERSRVLAAPRDDDHVRRQPRERLPGRACRAAAQVRRAAGQVDAAVCARRARSSLTALRDGLVGDAARTDHRDLGPGTRESMIFLMMVLTAVVVAKLRKQAGHRLEVEIL